MGRSSTSSDIVSSPEGNGDLGFKSIRDRFLFKRNPHADYYHKEDEEDKDRKSDRQLRNRSHHTRIGRKGFVFKGIHLFYFIIIFAIVAFVGASLVLQSSITSVFRRGTERGRTFREGLKFGGSLRFHPVKLLTRFSKQGGGVDPLRIDAKLALRPPRLAVVLGNMKKDPSALLLFTILKSLQGLGYQLKIYAVEDGNARTLWEQIGGRLFFLSHNSTSLVDWSIYEGVIVNSLEAKEAISRGRSLWPRKRLSVGLGSAINLLSFICESKMSQIGDRVVRSLWRQQ